MLVVIVLGVIITIIVVGVVLGGNAENEYEL